MSKPTASRHDLQMIAHRAMLEHGLLPEFDSNRARGAAGYQRTWQVSQEVEEEIVLGRRRLVQRKGATPTELAHATLDVNIGMLFSNVVMYFIMLATAATLFKSGKTDVKTAVEAAEALRPLAGEGARILLAMGLIGAGFLAVPILTGSAAYAVSEVFGWRSGLNEKPRRARAFYGVIAGSTLVGMLLSYSGINPIDALIWTAVINGLLAPPRHAGSRALLNLPSVSWEAKRALLRGLSFRRAEDENSRRMSYHRNADDLALHKPLERSLATTRTSSTRILGQPMQFPRLRPCEQL